MPFSEKYVRDIQPQLPLFSRLAVGGQAFGIVGAVGSLKFFYNGYQYFSPSAYKPDLKKTYPIRPSLPVSIFIPSTHADKSSTTTLPTLFTIHGGGFTIGEPEDDAKWNRTFAETHGILVVALNYSKAPAHPFPAAIYDLEALIIATLADSSIPIDNKNCAISGFSAGGNLTMAVVQLQGVKDAFKQYGSEGFRAAIPVYPALDRTISRDWKVMQRQYKPTLSPNRNAKVDFLLSPGKAFDWSYVPVGQNLRDPLLSPIFAARDTLPPYVFMVACELDLSSHDAWRMACQMAGRPVPSMDEKTGREENGKMGELELLDEKFAWEDRSKGVRWMLIPDAMHAFDHLPPSMQGDQTSVRDAEEKTTKVIKEIGDWLKTRAWA